MKIHNVPQGSDEWLEVRRGKFTASQAVKIITPTGKKSTSYRGELGRIIAEHLQLQEPENTLVTEWMDRGTEMEDEARAWLEVMTGETVDLMGFVEDESGLLGASPDGVIINDAGITPVEIKCPKPGTHIQWLLDGVLPSTHRAQVHMQMVLLEASQAVFMSYHPELEPLLVHVDADGYTDRLRTYLDDYIEDYRQAHDFITGVKSK